MKSSIPIDNFFSKKQKGSTTTTSSTTVAAARSKPKPNIKSGSSNPKRNKPLSISGYMDPTLNIKTQPTNGLEKWALGNMYKIVHQGANKCSLNQ